MHSVEEAAAAVAERVVRLATELVALRDAGGRVLAADVTSPRALPAFDNSAMDGYAARSVELPSALPIFATIGAGDALPSDAIPERVAVRIFTGAPMPTALDTVVIQEDAKLEDNGNVTLPVSPAGDNIRRAGEDIAIGEVAVAAGVRLGPPELGLRAAIGIPDVAVVRPPRV